MLKEMAIPGDRIAEEEESEDTDTCFILVYINSIDILQNTQKINNKDNYAFSLADDSSIEDQSHFSISCLLHEPYIFNV